jgi:peroxiredoxin
VTIHLSTRKQVGDAVAPFTLETLSHGSKAVPAGEFTHLQFRRFAGCPVCNLHLRSFAQGVNKLQAAKVETVAFFVSDRAAMLPYQGDLPFAVVPDPERHWYTVFGVENSGLAVMHPSAMWAAFKGMASVRSNPLQKGEHDGLPADFLLDARGTIMALHYGRHANDQWSVDEVIALTRLSRAD